MPNSAAQNVMTLPRLPQGEAAPPKPTMRQLFESEEVPLVRFAYGLLGRREVAEEIVQEGFLALFENFDQVENPRAWLYRAIRNKALNEIRKRQRETLDDTLPEAPDDAGESPDTVLARLEAAGQLQLLIAELAQRDGELLRLKYQEGLGYKEIAERTKMSVGNVGYRLHHLLKSLADGLRKVGVEGRLG
ncbi:RNA polymerase sigma factor [Roseibacillus ishigakijimensis]|uniref:Sigma-70 family RNA polymerase sigma factor n=1 Tax=Roseibacillus ishigakijimensis TaxID=454146 RepID=A0A934RQV8_9BACT|nr:sigma-70 family RNA polymerase sigma factor [Roseibacillus ishigakijimensis]MBK1833788.1 sigma-70 family RNA polymerase sigma factor [Roseibacillus ishigakijimensis]